MARNATKEDLSDLIEVSVGDYLKKSMKYFSHCLSLNLPTKPHMLWGSTGIGKSEGIEQLRQGLSETLGKEFALIDIRLSSYNPVDLKGIPFPDESRQFANWLQLGNLPNEQEHGKYGILFLDELTNATKSVQAVIYQLVLDRKIEGYTLPQNWIVIAAGNRSEDSETANGLLKPLNNRFTHWHLKADYNSWLNWAVKNEIHPAIITAIRVNPTLLNDMQSGERVAFCTPRSWAAASDYVKIFGVEGAREELCGVIGKDAYSTLLKISNSDVEVLNRDDILNGNYDKSTLTIETSMYIVDTLNNTLVNYVNSLNDTVKRERGLHLEITKQDLVSALKHLSGFKKALLQPIIATAMSNETAASICKEATLNI